MVVKWSSRKRVELELAEVESSANSAASVDSSEALLDNSPSSADLCVEQGKEERTAAGPWVFLEVEEEGERKEEEKKEEEEEPREQIRRSCSRIPADWASFPARGLPVSYESGEVEQKKNSTFSSPLVKEVEEVSVVLTPRKKRKTGKLMGRVLGVLKEKMLCCGHF